MKKLLATLVCILPLSIHAYSLKDLENSIKKSNYHECEQILFSDISVKPQDLDHLITLSNNVIESRKTDCSMYSAEHLLSAGAIAFGGTILYKNLRLKIREYNVYEFFVMIYEIQKKQQAQRERFSPWGHESSDNIFVNEKPSLFNVIFNRTLAFCGIGAGIVGAAYAFLAQHASRKKLLLNHAIEINYLLLQYQSNCNNR